jgi:hypothetical protein
MNHLYFRMPKTMTPKPAAKTKSTRFMAGVRRIFSVTGAVPMSLARFSRSSSKVGLFAGSFRILAA